MDFERPFAENRGTAALDGHSSWVDVLPLNDSADVVENHAVYSNILSSYYIGIDDPWFSPECALIAFFKLVRCVTKREMGEAFTLLGGFLVPTPI
jgi:hypothetical protein